MQSTFTMICKNPLSQLLVLRNWETKFVRFFQDQSPLPIGLTQGAERLVNLKLGIPIKFLGILRFDYKIDKAKISQNIDTIYYAETPSKQETFESLGKDLFENEDLIWLDKGEILKWGNENCKSWIEYLEKGGKYYPLSYIGEEK